MSISLKSRAAAALITLALVAAPLAHAGPGSLEPENLPCWPTCSKELGIATNEAPAATPVEAAGFDWADAAVGFGVGASALLVAAGCGLIFRRTHRRFGVS